jgi:hypothetical protein
MDEQFLREEIAKVEGIQAKANHHKIVKDDLNERYTILS